MQNLAQYHRLTSLTIRSKVDMLAGFDLDILGDIDDPLAGLPGETAVETLQTLTLDGTLHKHAHYLFRTIVAPNLEELVVRNIEHGWVSKLLQVIKGRVNDRYLRSLTRLSFDRASEVTIGFSLMQAPYCQHLRFRGVRSERLVQDLGKNMVGNRMPGEPPLGWICPGLTTLELECMHVDAVMLRQLVVQRQRHATTKATSDTGNMTRPVPLEVLHVKSARSTGRREFVEEKEWLKQNLREFSWTEVDPAYFHDLPRERTEPSYRHAGFQIPFTPAEH